MSCERNANRTMSTAIACGISQVANKAGQFAGQARHRSDEMLTRNPDIIRNFYLTGQLGLAAAAATVYATKTAQTKTRTTRDGERSITFARTQKGSLQMTKQDRQATNVVQDAIATVEKQVGQTHIRDITLGDDFGFSKAVSELGQRQLNAQAEGATGLSRLRKKAAGRYYRLIKPIIFGKLYLGTKLGGSPLAVAGQETGEIAFNQKYLTTQRQDKAGNNLDYGRYIATHEALHQVKRDRQEQEPGMISKLFAFEKEEALVDAIATRLVNSEYRGRRSGYDTIRRLADWQARIIAQRTDEQPLEVLIRQLKSHPQPMRST
ncbi:MAG: hypothetical protein AAF629_05275 [Chloroflexota bacterium]